MKLNKKDAGRLCLVEWTDIGRADTMIMEIDDDRRNAKVYCFYDSTVQDIEATQIVEMGNYVTPNAICKK